jgi:hypothetical protein
VLALVKSICNYGEDHLCRRRLFSIVGKRLPIGNCAENLAAGNLGKDHRCGRLELNGYATGTTRRKVRMKKIAMVIGVLSMAGFMAACGPDMATINSASDRAEADATRAEAAASAAEAAANQADAASKQADAAAAGAEDATRRANDAVSRLEAAFSTSVTK